MAFGDVLRKASAIFVESDPKEEPAVREHPHDTRAHAPAAESDEYSKWLKDDDGKAPAKPTPVAEAATETPPPLPRPAIADGLGNVSFVILYSTGAVPSTPLPAEKTLELIASLPDSLPVEIKRQTVRISVQAMAGTIGATAETVLADAHAKKLAIMQFVQSTDSDTEQYVSAANEKIRQHESAIALIKNSVQEAQTRRERIHEACEAEASRLQEVAGFFET